MKKGKIINFEILWDSNEPMEVVVPKILSKDIRQAAQEGYNTILGIMLNEGVLPYDTDGSLIFHKLDNLAKELGIEIILLSSVGERFRYTTIPFKVINFNYHARLVYSAYKHKEHNSINSDKFLFLGGVPTRPNRIGLLNKFYKNNLFDCMDWSFFPPKYAEDKEWCRHHLDEYNDRDYNKFINLSERKFDNVYAEITELIHDSEQAHGNEWFEVTKLDFFKSPGYINESVFNTTLFSVVSEGPNFWTEDYRFITLITWRTIINKHPFIFAGHPEQFEYIKSLGFKTFEDHLLIKDYAYIQDEDARLDAVVKNAKYLLDNFNSCVTKDAEYNYNRYLEIIKEQDSLFEYFRTALGIDRSEINYYLNQTGISHLVRNLDV